MTDQLDFPQIESASTAVAATAPEGALDFEKVDLKTIALAQFGDWRKDVTDVEAKLTGVVHDLSTQTKVDDAKSLRHRLINVPLAKQRKVSKALKSKLNDVSKDVGAELEAIESGYANAEKLITPQIEAADAKLEAERLERARKEEERVAAHEARLGTFLNVITRAHGLPSERIAAAIAAVDGTVINPDEWEEFAARAEAVKGETLTTLRDMHAKSVEAERIEAQRIENERIAAELEARRLALEKKEREQAAEARRLAAIEEERVARIDARLANLAAKRAYTSDQSVNMINAALLEMSRNPPTADLYAERVDEGIASHDAAVEHLKMLLPVAVAREEAEIMARLAAEAAAAEPAPSETQAQLIERGREIVNDIIAAEVLSDAIGEKSETLAGRVLRLANELSYFEAGEGDSYRRETGARDRCYQEFRAAVADAKANGVKVNLRGCLVDQSIINALMPEDVVPVAAPVAQIRQPDPAPAPVSEPEQVRVMKLSEINEAFEGKFTVSGDGLAALGFDALPVKGAAKLYRASDFDRICNAISDHAHTVRARRSLEKAA